MIYAKAVKRSVTIAGHETSIALEPIFWTALEAAAARDALPLNAVIARVDAARIRIEDPPNLASALRIWLFEQATMPAIPDATICDNDENHSQ